MKYERSKIKDPLTGIELRELLDYVDTLELFAQRVATHWDDKDLAGQARKALDKGEAR